LAEQNKIFRKFQEIKRIVYDYSGVLYNGHQKHQDSPKIYHLEEKINDAKIQLRE
jgi:hydroxyacyl-ACP dehydratase HTD2-like protein with hotdog domain